MMGEFWFLLGTIAVIAILAGFVHSAIGFGFGIVAISLMPFVIDARSAHVIVSLSSVPMLMMAAWAYREGIEWASIKQALLGAAIFLPPGLFLFETVSLDWLVRGTGFAILVAVLLSFRNQNSTRENESPKSSCFVAGALAGFLGGAVSIAGPPIVAFAFKQDWSQARFKAFVTQCLLIISIYKTALLTIRDYVVGDVVWQAIIVAVLSIGGVQLGVIASRRIPAARFRRLVAVALIIVSCFLMWQGQSEESEQDRSPTEVPTAAPGFSDAAKTQCVAVV
jgi:uncharacterized membrane protein YfcA